MKGNPVSHRDGTDVEPLRDAFAPKKEDEASEQDKYERLKRATESESLQLKHKNIVQKQKEAEQFMSEANDRLLQAAANQNTTDLLAAQALLQSGTTKLMEAHTEQDNR